MGSQKWSEIKDLRMTSERRERLDREVKAELLSMELRELRELAGVTQDDVAEAGKMTQPQVSKIENQGDLLLSTLRRYVEALGGKLEVVAVLGNKRVTLTV
jgi:predicted XRE-type DNA-binding protein